MLSWMFAKARGWFLERVFLSGFFRVGCFEWVFRVAFSCYSHTNILCSMCADLEVDFSSGVFRVCCSEWGFSSGFFLFSPYKYIFFCFFHTNTFFWKLSDVSYRLFVEFWLISNTICWEKNFADFLCENTNTFYVRGKEQTHSEKSCTGFIRPRMD